MTLALALTENDISQRTLNTQHTHIVCCVKSALKEAANTTLTNK